MIDLTALRNVSICPPASTYPTQGDMPERHISGMYRWAGLPHCTRHIRFRTTALIALYACSSLQLLIHSGCLKRPMLFSGGKTNSTTIPPQFCIYIRYQAEIRFSACIVPASPFITPLWAIEHSYRKRRWNKWKMDLSHLFMNVGNRDHDSVHSAGSGRRPVLIMSLVTVGKRRQGNADRGP